MYYLSVLAIFKNETMNLKMWLNHYLWQGVDHFYLIDNGSDDNPLSILQEYIDKGIVSYFYLPEQHKQLQHYRYVYDTIKLNTKWLTICDLDEFFFGLKHPLVNTIKTLETKYDYIVCNWKMFGSDGLITHPLDIRSAITHCKKMLARQTKYIFKTEKIDSSCICVHELNSCNLRMYNENILVQLNHYPIQSLEFFKKVKMTRGDSNYIDLKNFRDMNYFKEYDYREVQDEILKNLIRYNYKIHHFRRLNKLSMKFI